MGSFFVSVVLLSSSLTHAIHLKSQTDKTVMYKGAVNRVWDELSAAEQACFYKQQGFHGHIQGPNGRRRQKADSPGDCQAQCVNFTDCYWFDFRPCTGNCFFGAADASLKHKAVAISGERTCPTPTPTASPTTSPTISPTI